MLNRLFTKIYNGDDVNVVAAELGLIKTRSTFFIRNKETLSFIRNNFDRYK